MRQALTPRPPLPPQQERGRLHQAWLIRLPLSRSGGRGGRARSASDGRAFFLLLTAFLLTVCAANSPDKLPGTDLGATPAADFRLTDAQGDNVALSDFRGRPVALSFLYTDCPDVCPLIAQRLGQAMNQLGGDAAKVAVLAVSVDPEGDTPVKAAEFMSRHGLTGPGRHYLLGDESTLAPVWLAYGIGTSPIVQGSRQPGEPAQVGRVGHTDATILIDQEGRKRSLLRSEATAGEIAAGLRSLLR